MNPNDDDSHSGEQLLVSCSSIAHKLMARATSPRVSNATLLSSSKMRMRDDDSLRIVDGQFEWSNVQRLAPANMALSPWQQRLRPQVVGLKTVRTT